jgi:hypothetical protein
MSCPCRESNPNFSTIQPVAYRFSTKYNGVLMLDLVFSRQPVCNVLSFEISRQPVCNVLSFEISRRTIREEVSGRLPKRGVKLLTCHAASRQTNPYSSQYHVSSLTEDANWPAYEL